MNRTGRCIRRLTLLMRYAVCRPAPLTAWFGLPVAFILFTALTSVSVRLMLSTDSKLDGLATLAGMGPSIAGTAILEPTPGINPVLSGAIALAYAVTAIGIACIAQKQRDIR